MDILDLDWYTVFAIGWCQHTGWIREFLLFDIHECVDCLSIKDWYSKECKDSYESRRNKVLDYVYDVIAKPSEILDLHMDEVHYVSEINSDIINSGKKIITIGSNSKFDFDKEQQYMEI